MVSRKRLGIESVPDAQADWDRDFQSFFVAVPDQLQILPFG